MAVTLTREEFVQKHLKLENIRRVVEDAVRLHSTFVDVELEINRIIDHDYADYLCIEV